MRAYPNPRTAAIVLAAGPLVASMAVPLRPAVAQARGAFLAPTMLVLDASGSMAAAAPGGTRMDAAKKALRSVVSGTPAQARMGLTVYGTGTGSAPADKPAGCKDVKVVRQAGPLDKSGLTGAADALKPRGYTPIGHSLRVAADALPKQGPRSIVLVSDGEDTCGPPDPCQVAAELAKKGVDLRVHTVGYGVRGTARDQLTCIAKATGGTYTNVPAAGGLGQALTRVTASALRNYQPAGRPVTGTPVRQGAPLLQPGGHVDTIGFVRKRYYAVDVPANNTVYFAATVPFQRGGSRKVEGLNVSPAGPAGGGCGIITGTDVNTGGEDGEAANAAVSWDTTPGGSGSVSDECRKPGRYTFEVSFTGASDSGSIDADKAERLPMELQVGLEPPARDKGPEPAGSPVAFEAPGGAPASVTGGGSFGTAAALPGSGRYAEQVRLGEVVYYRVRLGWGQGIAYKIGYGGRERIEAANVKSALFTPARQQAASEDLPYSGQAMTLPSSGAFATLPLRYRNRDEDDQDQRVQSIPGWHYIAVKAGLPFGSNNPDGTAVPVTLDLRVTGKPEKGPTYTTAAQNDIFGTPPGPTAKSDDQAALPWKIILPTTAAALAVIAAIATTLIARRRRP